MRSITQFIDLIGIGAIITVTIALPITRLQVARRPSETHSEFNVHICAFSIMMGKSGRAARAKTWEGIETPEKWMSIISRNSGSCFYSNHRATRGAANNGTTPASSSSELDSCAGN
jgi:hypothetical protein